MFWRVWKQEKKSGRISDVHWHGGGGSHSKWTRSSLEQHIVSDQTHVRLSLQKIGFM